MLEAFTVFSIALLAAISPGPDFVMVTRNALLVTKRVGVICALGIGAGLLVHVAYVVAGLGLLMTQSLILFQALKIAGALYLGYLGWQLIRSSGAELNVEGARREMSDWAAFRMGFITNVTNPKAPVFLVSLFSTVISVDTSLITKAAYGLMIGAVTALWFVLVALFLSQDGVRAVFQRFSRWIDRLFGGLLLFYSFSMIVSVFKKS